MLPIKFLECSWKGGRGGHAQYEGASYVVKRDNVAPNFMAMLPKSMVRVTDVFIVNSSKTSITLTILLGNIAIKFGATLSLSMR